MRRFISLACLIVMMTSLAQAWQHRGGGDGVLDDGNWSLLDLAEKHESEYYFPHRQQYFKTYVVERLAFVANQCAYPMYYLMQLQTGMVNVMYDWYMTKSSWGENVDPNFIFPHVFINHHHAPANRTLPHTREQFYDIGKIDTNLTAGEIVWMMTDRELEEIPDEGTIRLPSDGSIKKQVAIQKNGVVLIYRPIFEKMDDRNKAALILHELMLFAAMHSGASELMANGTQSVRYLVHNLFIESYTDLPRSFFESLCGWNGKLFKDLTVTAVPRPRSQGSGDVYNLSIKR